MKLLLASKEKFLIHKGYSLLDIPKDQLRIGFINTALKVVENLVYLAYMKEYVKEMQEAHIHFKEFDIKDKTEKEIQTFFADKNVIQVSGGNPFYLLKNVRKSAFDKVLRKLLDNGLYYVGCSAGSFIMCPTIEVGGWKAGRNRHGVTDVTALGYVPFLLKCHYTDDMKETVLKNMKDIKYPLRILRDDQAFFIKDNICTFIGDEEVKFNTNISHINLPSLEIASPGEDPAPTMPPDLEKALLVNVKANALWNNITPIARRDWIMWIVTAKQEETRTRRIQKACSMLSTGKRRVCCFGGFRWLAKMSLKNHLSTGQASKSA